MKYAMIKVYKVLGLLQQNSPKVLNEIKDKYVKINNLNVKEINELLVTRLELKEVKEYVKADAIRNYL